MPTRRPTRHRLSQMYQRVNRRAVHGAACSEDEHQEAFISWVNDTEELQTDAVKREALHWLHHVPNGKGRGRRIVTRTASLPPPEAFHLKLMGLRPGIFDLRLDYHVLTPTDEHPGLLIEMKADELVVLGKRLRRAGTMSLEQTRYRRFMESQGFLCHVCRSWQSAAQAITEYLQLEKIAPVYVLEHGEGTRAVQVTDPAVLLTMKMD